VKRRITFSIVGVTVVALLVLGVPLALAVGRLYRNEEVLRLEREANEARTAVSTSKLQRGERLQIGSDDDANRFVVYDNRGRSLGGRGPARADTATRHALDGDSADERIGDRIIVAVPINGDNEVIGALRASRSSGRLDGRTHRAWLVMALFALVAVAVAALLAWWQARRLTRPIDELVRAAQRLGGGDFSTTTEPSGVEELDQLGAALTTTSARLGNLIGRERAFSTDASHQLRTPIAGLRVKVEGALLAPESDARTTLEELLPPIDRLETTVEDLLHLARDSDVDRSPLDAATVLRDAAAEWTEPLAEHGRSLDVVIEADLPAPVVAEPAIREILRVLMANAAAHGAGIVTMAARSSVPGAVVIQVSDEGTGALDPRRVFERRRGGGHGVGLALARTLAEAEGARLILERTGPAPMFAIVIPTNPSGGGSVTGNDAGPHDGA
jgi:signal transduction histidine kinase